MNSVHDKRHKKEKGKGKVPLPFSFYSQLPSTATAAAVAGAAAHATEAAAKAAAAETAAPGTAPKGAAAHAAKAAAARRPGATEVAVEAARWGRRRAATSARRPGPTEAPQPAAGAGKNVGHRPDDDDEQNHADHKGQDVGQGAVAAALAALITGLHGAAVAGAAGKADPVNIRDGVCHVAGTGGHCAVIILCGKLILHGLGDGAGLLCQRGVAEAIAVGQVVVAVRVLRRLHHQ